jgi:hypothetical protein
MVTREISFRLTEKVKAEAPTMFDRLQPALDLANQQLEAICPAVMAMTKKGFFGDLVVTVKQGTWLILLANSKKVFLMSFMPPPAPYTRAQIIEDFVQGAIEQLGHVPTPAETLFVMDDVINRQGCKPLGTMPNLDEQIALQILGVLFASHPDRAGLIAQVEECAANNVCPLHVGLVGKGKKAKTKCGVWPLGINFATYLEYVDKLDAERTT